MTSSTTLQSARWIYSSQHCADVNSTRPFVKERSVLTADCTNSWIYHDNLGQFIVTKPSVWLFYSGLDNDSAVLSTVWYNINCLLQSGQNWDRQTDRHMYKYYEHSAVYCSCFSEHLVFQRARMVQGAELWRRVTENGWEKTEWTDLARGINK